MSAFSKDRDILKYEPVLFGDLHFPGQELSQGVGSLSGTEFSCEDAAFIPAGVKTGGVIYLQSEDCSVDGAFEIVSVNSSTELTVSVLRADEADVPISVGSAENLNYRISTFEPQAQDVFSALTQHFGLRPGDPSGRFSAEDIADVGVLRQASAYAVITAVYATLGNKTYGNNFWEKSLYYRRLFERARERCRVSIDIGGDGTADITNIGSYIRLIRN